MLRRSIMVLLATALAACGGPDDTLTAMRLPGFEVALPGWDEVSRVEAWASGAITRKERSGRRALVLQWSLGAPDDIDYTAQQLEPLERELGAALVVEPPRPLTVGGHEGQDVVLGGAVDGHLTAWHCPEHQRTYVLLLIGPHSVHDGVIASLRCHSEPAPARAAGDFARFEPPPAMKREPDPDDPSQRLWFDGTSTVTLVAATVAVGALQTFTERPKLVLSTYYARTVDTFEQTVGPDGQLRWLTTHELTDEDGTFDVREVMWVCPTDRMLYASHTSPKGAVTTADANAVLLLAQCP